MHGGKRKKKLTKKLAVVRLNPYHILSNKDSNWISTNLFWIRNNITLVTGSDPKVLDMKQFLKNVILKKIIIIS